MKSVSHVLLAALLAAVGTVAATAQPAAAASLPGIVLTSSAATLPAELAPLATGRRIQYVTTGVTGNVITATGLILTPKTGKNGKIVAWGHGTTGLADQCAPSTNQGVFWEEARIAVAELLSRGWTVTAPDYPGLGTAQAHPYLIGASAGRSLIDSVKAARNLDASLSLQYVVDGHSQGGQGALFASQLAPSYDGTLQLKGTASIAPVSNTEQIIPVIAGTEGQGYLVMALYGLAAVDPTFHPYSVLAAPAEAKTGVLSTGCLYEILATYKNFTAAQLVTNGQVPVAVVNKLAAYENPAQTAPSAPVLIVHGTDDEAVPFFLSTDYLVPKIQSYGVPVTFLGLPDADHDEAVIESADYVADWIAARFA
ncbi:putative secreted lipase [Actinoplanes missouriensis 431]|uniref:Putative secreted lipase n=1 Tax=Actinoplanes missouriensis (strain ATCC 14538 / DSM 43046 / CBS 188.64 / JCM 3121 / NBRC 102363 / NCIMB 12654 / NRRL B-3342 / UNCC 431) TaxID=512565 RepID=I0HAJ4_ACTM4|nr:alpha/beta fold hydrolase [Actinoplanes missouriensis]BAL90031.1 putative secreted lipase [Actinoplanes missouriensis 431]